jgi:hypothetical protein
MTASSTAFRAPDRSACARLNDDCRWSRGDRGSFRQVMTSGVCALLDGDPGDTRTTILRQAQLQAEIRNYGFKPGDGPERNFGAITVLGHKLLFKIDAYDRALEHGSPDPADAAVTVRVMTIMLAGEY